MTGSGKAVFAVLVASLALPGQAGAQTMVSAADPAALVRAMAGAGYPAEVSQETTGEPEIATKFFGWPGSIRFYDCNPSTHDQCRSLQFQVGFDRAEPMPPALANYLMANVRYVGIFLDEGGDPWVSWDVLTGDGIPAAVFVEALDTFAAQVDLVANTVFENERAAD